VVTCVGKRDPFGPEDPYTGESDGPVLALLQALQDRDYGIAQVVLCATEMHEHEIPLEDGSTGRYLQGGTESSARQTAEEIGERWPSASAEVVLLRVNPTDTGEVISGLQAGLGGVDLVGDEVHVNTTSGTPTMSAGLAFLADSGFLRADGVWRVVDRATITLTGGAEPARIAEVDLSFLAERGRLERALGSLRGMAFGRSRDAFAALSKRSLLSRRRKRAAQAVNLAEAYALWDRAQFGTAGEKLRAFLRGWEDELGCLELMKRQAEALIPAGPCDVRERGGPARHLLRRPSQVRSGELRERGHQGAPALRGHLQPSHLPGGARQLKYKLADEVAKEARDLLTGFDDRAGGFLKSERGYRIRALPPRRELVRLLIERRVLTGSRRRTWKSCTLFTRSSTAFGTIATTNTA
jgi:hypothetical protein